MKDEIIKYAKGLNAKNNVIQFLDNLNLENKQQGEVEHIIDYLIFKDFSSLQWASYDLLKAKSQKWINQLSQNVASIDEEYGIDIEIVLDFEDGFKIVKLVSESAYRREGALMSHCVASYFGKNVEIYSLRDEMNKPHCTIEKDTQIKGKGNQEISIKYILYIVKFLEWTGMKVRDNEMKNLGYIVPPFHQYTKNKKFREKYIKKNEEIIYDDEVIIFGTFEDFKNYNGDKKFKLVDNYVDLRNATIPKGFIMPDSCGYVDLRGATIPEGFVMPKSCKNIYLRNATIPEGFVMPKSCRNIYLEGTTIPEGFVMPDSCGCVDLEGTTIPEGFVMPDSCGNIYLRNATIPEGLKMPENCGNVYKK